MREDEDFSKAMLLLDSSITLMSEDEELRVTDEEDSFLTLEEDFAESMLLLEASTVLEEEFAVATLLLDSFLTLEEDFAESMLLQDSSMTLMSEDEELRVTEEEDSSLSLGVTGEELPSSSQAARRSKLEIAKAIMLFDFFKAT